MDDQQRERLRLAYRMDFPDDMGALWSFAQQERPADPCRALEPALDIRLVGPFEILADGSLPASRPAADFLLHWRWQFDPPEATTIMVKASKPAIHYAYFRDAPDELPIGVVSNHAGKGGAFRRCGDTVIAAIWRLLQAEAGGELADLRRRFQRHAREAGVALTSEARWKARQAKVIAPTFSGLGIVVPYDRETEVGYRPPPVTSAELKRTFRELVDAREATRERARAALSEALTYVMIGNDECDFGTGLEVGLNLLTGPPRELTRHVESVLAVSYTLLNRPLFGNIVRAHMEHRFRASVSELELAPNPITPPEAAAAATIAADAADAADAAGRASAGPANGEKLATAEASESAIEPAQRQRRPRAQSSSAAPPHAGATTRATKRRRRA